MTPRSSRERLSRRWAIALWVAVTAAVYTALMLYTLYVCVNDCNSAYRRGFESAQQAREQSAMVEDKFFVNVPLQLQTDPLWKDTTYSTGTIETHGCGLTVLSMMLTRLLGVPVYPNDLVEHEDAFIEAEVNNPDAMCRWAASTYKLTWSGERWGFKDNIDGMLADGYLVMCSMQGRIGERDYEGHVVLVYGIVDGCYLIRDPADGDNSVHLFTPAELDGVTWGALNGLKL